MNTRILYINDEPTTRDHDCKILEQKGYNVSSPPGYKTEDLKKETINILKKNSFIYNILILDLKFGNDRLGGLSLYIELESLGYANRWKNVIVFSRLEHLGTNNENKTIKTFLIDRGIDINNFLEYKEDLLLEKTKYILSKKTQ